MISFVHRFLRIPLLCLAVAVVLASFASRAGTAGGDRATSAFQAGLDALRKEDVRVASAFFKESARILPSSGALQNLGLAEWRSGNAGWAIAAWHQGALVDPFNKALEENLDFARRANQLDAPEFTWYEIVSTWLPASWWAVSLAGSCWFFFGVLVLPVFRKPNTTVYQALAALALMLFLLSVPAQIGVITRARVGFILAQDCPLRLTPTHEGQPIIKLPPGQPVRLKRQRKDFVLVQSGRGLGWVERKQIAFPGDLP
jgi:hypothetical protein